MAGTHGQRERANENKSDGRRDQWNVGWINKDNKGYREGERETE